MNTQTQTQTPTNTAMRTHNCGELRMSHQGQQVTLCGWVQKARDKKGMVFVDVRDRYGITQCIFTAPSPTSPTSPDPEAQLQLQLQFQTAQKLGREFVVQISGTVVERHAKNPNRDTGDIEIVASSLLVLNESKTPPFLVERDTDALEDVRMRYRFLDIRRDPVKEALILRHRTAQLVRSYLSSQGFIEVETPILIKSTPEGARDFVVPSRMNPGQFYALPQSPQTFKQLLMVGGLDKYFQLCRCFRDEELRADRQPEFTQIDCELSFVSQEDILRLFEEMMRALFLEIVGHEFPPFPRLSYAEAMTRYGSDKPDIRFEMPLCYLTESVRGGSKGFALFEGESIEAVIGLVYPGQAELSKKELKKLEKAAKDQSVGVNALIWVKVVSLEQGAEVLSSSVDKFYSTEELAGWARICGAQEGDLILVSSGESLPKTQDSMGKLRNELGSRLGLREGGFVGLWVVDFPLLEWDEEGQRWSAMHHPFTSAKAEDQHLMESDPGSVRANAYDMVVNGVELGGGSIRIHEREKQERVLELLGFSREEAVEQFGFLMSAFEYGAPPHGGLAFGLDRLCSLLGGEQSIRNYIAFPKNKQGRDLMIDTPSHISEVQKAELCIETVAKVSPGVTEE